MSPCAACPLQQLVIQDQRFQCSRPQCPEPWAEVEALECSEAEEGWVPLEIEPLEYRKWKGSQWDVGQEARIPDEEVPAECMACCSDIVEYSDHSNYFDHAHSLQGHNF